MLDFLKRERVPEGPFEFAGTVEIERPAEAVYPLIDLADARYSKRQLGERVEAIEGLQGGYLIVLGAMPDLAFELVLTERVPNASIGYDCLITPRVGELERSHERYRVEPTGENSCRLELVHTVTFRRKLPAADFEEEAFKLNVATHNALAKLKLHAEQGCDAVRAADAQLVVGFDFGDFGED